MIGTYVYRIRETGNGIRLDFNYNVRMEFIDVNPPSTCFISGLCFYYLKSKISITFYIINQYYNTGLLFKFKQQCVRTDKFQFLFAHFY